MKACWIIALVCGGMVITAPFATSAESVELFHASEGDPEFPQGIFDPSRTLTVGDPEYPEGARARRPSEGDPEHPDRQWFVLLPGAPSAPGLAALLSALFAAMR